MGTNDDLLYVGYNRIMDVLRVQQSSGSLFTIHPLKVSDLISQKKISKIFLKILKILKTFQKDSKFWKILRPFQKSFKFFMSLRTWKIKKLFICFSKLFL